MRVKLENLSDHPVVLLLSSGETVRLSPGQTSEELPDVALQTSGKIEKLSAQGVIAVHEPAKQPAAAKPAKSGAAKAAPKRDVSDTPKPATGAAKST